MLPWARIEEEQVQVRRLVQAPGEQAAHGHVEQVAAQVRPDPERSNHQATERESHSDARFAVHGASMGTRLEARSSLAWARAMVTHGQRADLRDETLVAQHAAGVDEQVGALDPRLVGGALRSRGPARRSLRVSGPARRLLGRRPSRRTGAGSRSGPRPGRGPRGRRPTCRCGAGAGRLRARRTRRPPRTHRHRSARACALHRNPGVTAGAEVTPRPMLEARRGLVADVCDGGVAICRAGWPRCRGTVRPPRRRRSRCGRSPRRAWPCPRSGGSRCST